MPYRHHLRSSPSCSASSHEDATPYASDKFFAPEYAATDISSWRSSLKREASMYYPQTPEDDASLVHPGYFIDSHSLYASPDMNSTAMHPRVPSPLHLTGHSSSPSVTNSMYTDGPPAKRSRKDPSQQAGRAQGACTRCKRLKMKCTFADNDNTCARCIVGGHECVVLGRKPRSPGMREILRKQIREKDTMIDTLLAKLNPVSSTSTPLSINPSRLALTQAQRTQYRDVLMYLDKAQNAAKLSSGDSSTRAKIDVSALDEEYEYDEESDDEGSGGSGADDLQQSTSSLHIHPLPQKFAPAGILASTTLESRSRLSSPVSGRDPTSSEGEPSQEDTTNDGFANSAYFQPGPYANLDLRRLIVERQAAPDIILSGLINNDDVGKLFQIYWRWINPVVLILDENIHTPAAVLGRCPFLFTVVCAVASRFYEEKPEVYPMAVHMAKAAAANAFLDGCKTVEMCQAFAIMSAYMPPARRWDEDRQFFYSGIAFRLAIDLELHRVPSVMPTDERGQREVLNRLRTHIICYVIDRCFCINLGKPFMIPEDDLIRNAASKFLGWTYSLGSDNYVVSVVELFRIMTRFIELANPALDSNASRDEIDIVGTHKVFSDELTAWFENASKRCAAELAPNADQDDRLRMGLMTSVYHYCRLVTFSAGLQEVLKRGTLKEDTIFFAGCLHAASAVINCVVERILPTGFVRYSPEHVFALSAFGTAVLAKCLRPEFSCKLDQLQETRIVALIKRLLQAIASDGMEDEQATPRRRFVQFLQQLIASRVLERRKHRAAAAAAAQCSSDSQSSELSEDCDESGRGLVPETEAQVLPQAPQAPTAAHHCVKMMMMPQLDVAMQDIPFGAWDPHPQQQQQMQQLPIHSDEMQTLFAFSETELMPTFMAFPDQSSSWFM